MTLPTLAFLYLFIGSARAAAVAVRPTGIFNNYTMTDIAITTLLWPWLTLVNIFWKLMFDLSNFKHFPEVE